ncbi:MAG: 16S rRNA (uracil(1498)-N(3))-methyltransferase [Proteobacteria bacterium]|nr:16S rRNA (uracil(1498)-N(3))-methyltransferase [Pseudomonadota bacterium]
MNIILFDRDEINDNTVTLSGRRAEHIIKILKSKVGDTLRTGVINGPSGTSTLHKISGPTVELLLDVHTTEPTPALVDIVLALPRPIMLKRVLAQVATFGVARLFLINSNRVEKSFFSASLLEGSKMRQRLLEGLEQAGDTLLPKVSVHGRFKPFVEDTLPQIASEYQAMLLAHPGSPYSLGQLIPPPLTGKVLLIIGPEGGWVDFEISLFSEKGAHPFHLGPRILRVDSVIPSLLGQLDLLRRLGLSCQ